MYKRQPYSFVYEADIPQWVNPDSKIKKPKQWFNSWLKCSGILLQPEFEPQKKLPTPKNSSQQSKTEIKKNHDSLILGQRIKNARKSSGISLRTAAKELSISASRLSQIENNRYPHPISCELENQLLEFFGLE